jgi:hypothetical protein
MIQRNPFRPSSTIQVQKYDSKSNGSPQQSAEASSFTNKHSFKVVHNKTPNYNEQYPNRIVSTDLAGLRTTINPKTPDARSYKL